MTDSQRKDSGSNDWWKKSLPENTKSINCQTHQPDLPVRHRQYFSKAGYHLESDVNNLIVNHKQQLDELQLLKMIKEPK